MDRATQAKIDPLLYEVRAWEDGRTLCTVEELARRFRLDPMVVARIMEAEGLEVDETTEFDAAEPGTGRRSTTVIDLAALDAARKRAAGENGEG